MSTPTIPTPPPPAVSTVDRRVRVAIAAWTALAGIAFVAGLPSAVRIPLLLVFTLVCPGLAWSRLYPLRDIGDTIAVSIGVSAALAVVVGEAMALTRWWSPGFGFAVLVAVTGVGLLRTPAPR